MSNSTTTHFTLYSKPANHKTAVEVDKSIKITCTNNDILNMFDQGCLLSQTSQNGPNQIV
ncbi:hypothetical protein Hanom_Chr03g00263611 [Helianthus anomalus]